MEQLPRIAAAPGALSQSAFATQRHTTDRAISRITLDPAVTRLVWSRPRTDQLQARAAPRRHGARHANAASENAYPSSSPLAESMPETGTLLPHLQADTAGTSNTPLDSGITPILLGLPFYSMNLRGPGRSYWLPHPPTSAEADGLSVFIDIDRLRDPAARNAVPKNNSVQERSVSSS